MVSCRYPAMTTDHNCNAHSHNSTSASHRSVVSGQELCTGAPALIGHVIDRHASADEDRVVQSSTLW